jgi:hypothetical protein
MDDPEFERLKATAKAHGDKLGVSAELQLADMKQSSFNPAGRRLLLRVFRFAPGESVPREYSESNGYALDARDLEARISQDIEIAARKLYETL